MNAKTTLRGFDYNLHKSTMLEACIEEYQSSVFSLGQNRSLTLEEAHIVKSSHVIINNGVLHKANLSNKSREMSIGTCAFF